ncbi:hypothetical protein GOBAR_AA28931 [Gossypium barbadense]|uniref:Uncharacterized protein n=1 Tax=Gossypium barbadense TaxID=3634 RepID=A0A2P5WL02_GOSBA|nr:hypothetical protein GOBAR_AA28931 [Gossypium barbadense]
MAGEYGIYLKCHKPGNLLLCLHELQPNQISNHPYKFHGSLFLVALFGGFISGTYLSRFKTCVLFGSIELLFAVGAIIVVTFIVWISKNQGNGHWMHARQLFWFPLYFKAWESHCKVFELAIKTQKFLQLGIGENCTRYPTPNFHHPTKHNHGIPISDSMDVHGCALLDALTAQAHFHRLRPPSCQGLAISQTTQCQAADSGHAAILFTGLYLVAFGASGVKAALLSLGADQFDERDPKRSSLF